MCYYDYGVIESMFSNNLSKKFIKDRVSENYIIEIKRKVTSTNLIMKEKAQTVAEDFSVLIAGEQTTGRGRLGRTFHSPKGTGIYMSILLTPEKDRNPLLITVDTAVCAARVLEKITGEKTLIKWVNDIYIKGKKVCGILAEKVGDKIVLGIGINVFSPKGGFPDDIKDRAGALFEVKERYIKEKVIAELLNELYSIYMNPVREELLAEYKNRSIVTGKNILILRNGGEEEAFAIDINDDYSLMVKKENGEIENISTGDVSIKI